MAAVSPKGNGTAEAARRTGGERKLDSYA